jgi:hypothetical protein
VNYNFDCLAFFFHPWVMGERKNKFIMSKQSANFHFKDTVDDDSFIPSKLVCFLGASNSSKDGP